MPTEHQIEPHILYINSRSACVCDGARVRHRRTTGTGPEKTGFGKREKTGFGKSGLGKTGFGLQADRARPGKNGLISVCALQLQLQSYKRVYVCPELTCLHHDLFLFVAKMAIICRKMWKKWAIL
jgi:hypothetical protein